MAKKQKSKASSRVKTQNRALNAFEIAQKAENRAQGGPDDSGSDDPYADPDASDKSEEEDGEAEEDEEIDSDEAFGSSDEEEILDSTNWRQKRKSWKQKGKGSDGEQDSNDEQEEEGGYSSIDESELLPLSAVWDLDDKDLEESTKAGEEEDSGTKVNDIKINEQAEASSSEEDSDENGDDDDDDDEDSDDDLSMSDEDFDDVDEEKLSSLRAMISDMNNTDTITIEAAANLKKGKLVQMSNVSEGEFAVPVGGDGKLSLADLTNSIDDARATASLSLLQDTTSRDKAAPLSVPLPSRLQERLDRGAAYDISKKEVSKWKDTINANRDAEHLQFPINPAPEFTKPSSFSVLEPETSLEKRVNSILQESALADEKNESTFEQLAPSTLSMAELRKRRNELRQMRDLMFREEQKARRIKKIKSKTYRKIHKKQREHERGLVEEDDEDSDEAAEDHDTARAEERMSLRHKNTGKWAKSMVQQGFTKDKATRSEMEQMLRRGEQLRTKILGREEIEEEFDDTEEQFLEQRDASSDNEEVKRIKERAGKGVLAMKFMKDAEAAERKRNQLAKQEIKNSMEKGSILSDDDDESKGANVVLNEGRRRYAPGSKEVRDEMDETMDDVQDELEADEAKSLETRLSNKRKRNPLTDKAPETESKSIRTSNSTAANRSKFTNGSSSLDDFAAFDSESEAEASAADETNPWLVTDSSARKKKTVTVVGRDSSNADKSEEKLRKQKEKLRASSKSKKSAAASEGIIDMNETLRVVDQFGSDAGSENDNDNDDGDDEETLNALIEAKPSAIKSNDNKNSSNKRVSFKQTDLVKRAFAGDDVVAEFEEEKREIAAQDGDKEVDVTLPGWGSWGGMDIVAPKRKFVKKIKGVVNEKNRKDYNLNGVIINEKVSKKAAVYKATAIPYPFETREQYERSLRMPIGQEWSTRDTHQKLIKPRVIIKPGLVIDPIKAPFQHGEDSD